MILIDRALCTGCGKCAGDCVAGKLTVPDGKAHYAGKCLNCGHCVAICPVGAASIPAYDMDDVEELSPGQHLELGELLTVIKGRRSVRQYQDRRVERKKLEMILEAGRYTATAMNLQGNRFILVQERLSEFRKELWAGLERAIEEGVPEVRPFRHVVKLRMREGVDFLIRDASAVLFILTNNIWDAGLAAQNMEHAALAQGLGVMYNGYLQRLATLVPEAGEFLGLDGSAVAACMLIGYPAVTYKRSAPREKAQVLWL